MPSRFVAAIAILLLAAPVLSTAQVLTARSRGGIPLPPQGQAYGQSLGEWSADWWRWVLEAPAPVNPVLDTTGASCAGGQQGGVWFLAGSFSAAPVERHCAVPAGRALFFPVINVAWIGFPTDPPMTAEEIRALLAPIGQATGLEVLVDGVPVPSLSRFLVTSPPFSVVAPADNIVGLPEGTLLAPCMTTGFYVMLTPLAPGRHTIVIRGTSEFFGFSQDVTYHLDVGADR